MREKNEFDMFIKNVIESNNYISSKNQMLIHLSERSIWNLVFKTFKDSIDRKPTNLAKGAYFMDAHIKTT